MGGELRGAVVSFLIRRVLVGPELEMIGRRVMYLHCADDHCTEWTPRKQDAARFPESEAIHLAQVVGGAAVDETERAR